MREELPRQMLWFGEMGMFLLPKITPEQTEVNLKNPFLIRNSFV